MTPNLLGDRPRKLKYDPDLANRLNREAELVEARERREALLGRKSSSPSKPPKGNPDPDPDPASDNRLISVGNYILMSQTSTYALGLHALQEACQKENNQHHPQITLPDGRKVYRANTFLEDILARMNDWETLTDGNGNTRTEDERKRYFITWLDSCGGIAYKQKTTKLKLQLICPQLMGIAKDHKSAFLSVNYAGFSGQEFDSSAPNFVHDAWLYLLEGRTDVYTDYLKTLKTITGRDVIPGFWKQQNTTTDELRAVFVDNLDIISGANGSSYLDNNGRFLRRSSP